MPKFNVTFKVSGRCTVEADTLVEAEALADASLFELTEIDLNDVEIDMVHSDVEES
ncbi:MAG: hypothetical protein ACTHJM_15750 [Marmoricola sp.]